MLYIKTHYYSQPFSHNAFTGDVYYRFNNGRQYENDFSEMLQILRDYAGKYEHFSDIDEKEWNQLPAT